MAGDVIGELVMGLVLTAPAWGVGELVGKGIVAYRNRERTFDGVLGDYARAYRHTAVLSHPTGTPHEYGTLADSVRLMTFGSDVPIRIDDGVDSWAN